MKFGLMFFSILTKDTQADKYELLLEAAKYADMHGYSSIWTPERHFDPLGALFPNPVITSTALAMITKHIKIRAGSLISPLHDTIRIAEDWSMVDNLSKGRVGISFGSGWNINDFTFYPDRFHNRKNIMFDQIKTVQRLWEGESLTKKNGQGEIVEVFTYPSPIQKKLPIWITSVGNKQTFIDAASIGANVLTHLLYQNQDELTMKVSVYREKLEEHEFNPMDHTVTVMLHTFINPDYEYVLSKVNEPLRQYMKGSLDLCLNSGQVLNKKVTTINNEKDYDELLDIKLGDFIKNTSLIGTPEKCVKLIESLQRIGIDEIACLADFGIGMQDILEGFNHLTDLKNHFN